jgi:peptidylamidoglycolate lyase
VTDNSSGHPVEVHGWDDNLKLGQVSAVDVNLNDDPVIFHRGPVVWDASYFGFDNVLREKKVIAEDTILTLDVDKGRVKSGFGSGLFYMPHGLKIDHEGNTWVTDVGMHQVFKFDKGDTKPSLGNYIFNMCYLFKQFCVVLGEAFVPGNDAGHFCKPTSVAIASTGQIFVADGSELFLLINFIILTLLYSGIATTG